MRSHWKRRVIPRWRASHVAAGRPESAANIQTTTVAGIASPGLIEEVRLRATEWASNRTIGIAADLLNFSHIKELHPLLEAPARFILEQGGRAPELLQSVARAIIGQIHEEPLKRLGCQYEIARLKERVRVNPRDALSLLDLARLYAAQGQNDHARKAIITAASLQPNHRFVIRSASRFLLHADDPDHAFYILNRSARAEQDPWVLSALIAVETIRGRTPKNLRRARAIMEGAVHAPRDISELGASLATVLIDAGEMKNAKRLLNTALREPNDNVVAQAAWAASEFRMPINLRTEWFSDAEASFYKEENAGNFEAALKAASHWFDDEPFSTRPLRGAAFAASIVKNFSHAEDAMRQALRLDPDNIECKNNLVFALLSQGRFDDAIPLLSEVIHVESQKEGTVTGHTLANIGMAHYRLGNIELGRKHYEEACDAFEKARQSSSYAIAAAYWAQEAINARDPEVGQLMDRLMKAVNASNTIAAKLVLKDAQGVTSEAPGEKPMISSSLIWTHDKARNILIVDNKQAFRVKDK